MKYFHFVKTFFTLLGTQNDYLYPFEGAIHPESYPFQKPHWWKTRIGFATAWNLAKIIAN